MSAWLDAVSDDLTRSLLAPPVADALLAGKNVPLPTSLSGIAVPLFARGEWLGVLSIGRDTDSPATPTRSPSPRRSPGAARWPWTTPASTRNARPSRTPCSRRCCRRNCRPSRAWASAPSTCPRAAASRSAATCTTSWPCPTAAGW
ncbi:hypothetical protein ACFQZ4_42240 [Catellatospora coxensis]